jgi:hypothetical protein
MVDARMHLYLKKTRKSDLLLDCPHLVVLPKKYVSAPRSERYSSYLST